MSQKIRATTGLKLLPIVGIAVLIILLPKFMGDFRTSQFTYVAIYFIAILGLNIVTGYAGQISLAQSGFMCLGAYVGAILILGRPGLEEQLHIPPGWLPIGDGMHPILAILIAGVVAGLAGFAFGFPALRLSGHALALATFSLALVIPTLAKRFESVTGGSSGVTLPVPTTPFGLKIATQDWLYYEAWILAGIIFFFVWLLLRTKFGRAFQAIRDSEVGAVASGVSLQLYKTLAFAISAFCGGIAGVLLVVNVAFINPDTFPLALSAILLASAVIGGLGSLKGVLFGALLFQFLPIYAQDPPFIETTFAKQAPAVVFGLVLILILVALPGGIAGALSKASHAMKRLFATRRKPGTSSED